MSLECLQTRKALSTTVQSGKKTKTKTTKQTKTQTNKQKKQSLKCYWITHKINSFVFIDCLVSNLHSRKGSTNIRHGLCCRKTTGEAATPENICGFPNSHPQFKRKTGWKANSELASCWLIVQITNNSWKPETLTAHTPRAQSILTMLTNHFQ